MKTAQVVFIARSAHSKFPLEISSSSPSRSALERLLSIFPLGKRIYTLYKKHHSQRASLSRNGGPLLVLAPPLAPTHPTNRAH